MRNVDWQAVQAWLVKEASEQEKEQQQSTHVEQRIACIVTRKVLESHARALQYGIEVSQLALAKRAIFGD